MKRISTLFTRVLPLIALTLLISCGDDDTQNTDSNDIIVGSWRYVGYIDTDGEYYPDEDETDCYDEVANFNKNGTGSAILLDCEEGDETNTYTWKKEAAANIYSFIFEDDNEPELNIIKFEGQNTMRIFYDDVEADVYERILPE